MAKPIYAREKNLREEYDAPSELDRSAIYMNTLPIFTSGRAM
jgi:hypothetical protein